VEKMLKEINNTLKETENLCEYDFLIQLEKILLLNGAEILLGELNTLSGYSLRLLYDYNNPFIFNESIPFISNNLLSFLNIDLRVYDISSWDLASSKLPFILYPENILVFSISKRIVSYYRMFEEESIDIEEVIKKNIKIVTLEELPALSRTDFYKKEVFRDLSLMLVSEFKTLGISSYEDFAIDLRNEEKRFSGLSHLWFNRASYSQWTALFGLRSYILGQFYFLRHAEQEILKETINGVEDSILYWKEWGRSVGRDSSFDASDRNQMGPRLRAANSLDKSRKSMEFVVRKFEDLL